MPDLNQFRAELQHAGALDGDGKVLEEPYARPVAMRHAGKVVSYRVGVFGGTKLYHLHASFSELTQEAWEYALSVSNLKLA